jgi:hypothetical protein
VPDNRLRGGKIRRRDRDYGLSGRPEYEDFWRWWHRVGKKRHGGTNIQDRAEAEERWNEWESEGRPGVKLGADNG